MENPYLKKSTLLSMRYFPVVGMAIGDVEVKSDGPLMKAVSVMVAVSVEVKAVIVPYVAVFAFAVIVAVTVLFHLIQLDRGGIVEYLQ